MKTVESVRMVRRYGLALRVVYALCLLGATYNHATILSKHGLFWDYGGVPNGSAAFWTTLTVLDPAAALLLFTRPRVGIATTAAIIVADVIHNLWLQARLYPPLVLRLLDTPQLLEQIAFMIFVIITAPFAWKAKPLP